MTKLQSLWNHRRLPVALAVVTLVLAMVAAWSAREAHALRGGPVAQNVALTDNARTSELQGQVSDIVSTVFSYDHADVAKTERAAQRLLTGKAVEQYNKMIAVIRKQAPSQKLVLTTEVTASGVRMLKGDRAHLVVFANQRSIRTDNDKTAMSGTMISVGAVYEDGRWKIENLDTFNS